MNREGHAVSALPEYREVVDHLMVKLSSVSRLFSSNVVDPKSVAMSKEVYFTGAGMVPAVLHL